MPTLIEHLEVLRHEMEMHRNPSKAVNMANYLQNRFSCFGIKTPVRTEIQKKWFAQIKSAQFNHWDIAFNLWNFDEREYHYIAIDLLKKVPQKQMQIDDHKFLKEILTTHSWWDSVDLIASNYVGKYFLQFPEQIEPIIQKWSQDSNLWLNRTCLIFQLKYKDEVDFELLKQLIIKFQHHPDFFIQKAIGWSLRQYSKFNPTDVKQFINAVQLKGLALREASKYL